MGVKIFIFIISSISFLVGIWSAIKIFKTRSWPKTVGKLLFAKSTRVKHATATGPRARFEVAVEYRYNVNGKTYNGENLFGFSKRAMSKEAADNFAAKISGSPEVHYNNANPSESFLIPSSPWIFLIIGLIGFFVSIMLFFDIFS